MANMKWVRKNYGVRAKRGMRVLYTGCGKREYGTIRSAASGGHLNIQLDGVRHTMPFHPTWELHYQPDELAQAAGAGTPA
jgi:hypothetical protein